MYHTLHHVKHSPGVFRLKFSSFISDSLLWESDHPFSEYFYRVCSNSCTAARTGNSGHGGAAVLPPRTDTKSIKMLIKSSEKLLLEYGILIYYIKTE